MYCNKTYFFSFCPEMIDHFLGSFCYRTHRNNYILSFRITIIGEGLILSSGELAYFGHV